MKQRRKNELFREIICFNLLNLSVLVLRVLLIAYYNQRCSLPLLQQNKYRVQGLVRACVRINVIYYKHWRVYLYLSLMRERQGWREEKPFNRYVACRTKEGASWGAWLTVHLTNTHTVVSCSMIFFLRSSIFFLLLFVLLSKKLIVANSMTAAKTNIRHRITK